MPSMTITITPEKWTRLAAALQQFRDEEEHPGETNEDLARRWFKMQAHGLVWSHERDHQGSDNAVPDFEMEIE